MNDESKQKNELLNIEIKKGNKYEKLLGKKISSDAELINWLSSGEDKKIDRQKQKFPFFRIKYQIKSKDFDKLIKIAKQCELFFKHKCKDEYIKKYCLNCSEKYFHQNDLLRFINVETFINYLKYIFFISNKIVSYSKTIFDKNRNDFEQIFNNMDTIKENWKFNEPKVICKQCMFKLVNKPNFCENIKKIILETPNNLEMSIELNENNNLDNFNKIDFKIKKIKKFNILDLKNQTQDNKHKNDSSNIIINNNNLNNNIFNTIIFNNNIPIFPYFLNNILDNLQYVNSNYIETLFSTLNILFNEILNISQSYNRNQIGSNECLIRINLLNKNISNCFILLDNSIRNNSFYLNKLISRYEASNNNTNIIFCIINNQNILDLLNALCLVFFNIENIFIGLLENDINIK